MSVAYFKGLEDNVLDSKKLHILLIEDESFVAASQKRQLERYHYDVTVAKNGEEALEFFKVSDKYGLVLADIDLGPGIDGTQAAFEILQIRFVPVIFLSSHTDPEIIKKTETITSYGYIVKSCGVAVIDASIKMALRLFKANETIKSYTDELETANQNLQQTVEELRSANEELKTSRENLEINEAMFHQFFNAIKEGAAIYCPVENGNNFEFIDLNNAGLEMSRLKREDVTGRMVTEIFPDVKRAGLLKVFQDVFKDGVSRSHPLTHYKDNRIEQWVENYVFTLPSGSLAAVYEDVTEKKTASEKLEKALSDNINLLKELQHRAKNSFSMIQSFTYLMEESAESSEVKAAVSDIRSRVTAIANMYELLYSKGTESSAAHYKVSLPLYLKTIVSAIIPPGIAIEESYGEMHLPVTRAIQTGLIVSEVLTNAVKYAFDKDGGRITIVSKIDETGDRGRYILKITDNGRGIDKERIKNNKNSFGLKFIHILAESLRGSFDIDNRKDPSGETGTVCILKF